MKRSIPVRNQDLRRLVLRRRLIRLGLYLLWLSVLLLGANRFNASHELHPLSGWRLALWLGGGAAVGFVLLRVYRLLTDRSFVGTIRRAGISRRAKGDEVRLHTTLRLTDEGTGRRRRLRFEQKDGFYLLFHEGVRVCKLSGLPYPLPDPQTVPDLTAPDTDRPNTAKSADRFCVVCGRVESPVAERCAGCGYSLLHAEELFGTQNEKEAR